MIEIIPSILTNDPNEARELILRCNGVVERISIDIIDGRFADNKTIDPDVLFDIDTDLNIDYQLIVIEPVNWIEKCVRGQADRIIGHIEYMNDQTKFVGKAQELGMEVGLAVDLDTSIEKLDPLIVTDLDVVMLMSVKAGFGGQEFDKKVIDKIKRLDEVRKKDDTPFKIHIDGGVTSDNIIKVIKSGADEVSVGRSLFKGDLTENIKKFQEAVRKIDTRQ
jgi:ribulose-phosphate 3-epimerase